MARYRPYSRRVLRRRLRTWLRAYAKELAAVVAGLTLLIAFEAFMLLVLGDPGAFQWCLFGALTAALVATLLGAVGLAFLVGDPVAIHQVRGAWGEENTRDELKKAQRKGHIWGWVDSVTLESGDIDHLVVSRQGGVVAIDSKWRSKIDAADRDTLIRDANTTRRRAEGVMRTVMSRERAGRRSDGTSLRVSPAIIVWGAAQTALPGQVTIDGVDFVPGRDLVQWLSALDGDAVDQGPADDLIALVETYREKTWPGSSGT